MKLEKEIEQYIEKYGDDLYDNGSIDIILDMRDAIIGRISKIRRQELMQSYLDKRTNDKPKEEEEYQETEYYEYLITKKIQLEEELSTINKELLHLML